MSDMDHFSGLIANATTSITADTPNCTGAYVVLFGVAHAGITVNFEGTVDGGTTWIPLAAQRIDSSTAIIASNNVALVTNSSNQFYVLVGASEQMRVRSSAYTSGTLSVNIQVVTDADPVSIASGATSGSTAPAALTDSSANPTAGQQGVNDFSYNGATWDRLRNNTAAAAVDSSSARTASGTGVTATNYNGTGCLIFLNVTAASGTTPTLVFKVQISPDNGTTWFDMDATNAASASLTAAGTSIIRVYPGIVGVAAGQCNNPLPRIWRLAWTIGGTTPSFTFTTSVSYIL